jgi:hypothetical protein
MPIAGIAAAALVDVLLPIGLAIALTRWNFRRRRSGVTEANFWVFAGIQLVIMGLLVWQGLVDVYAYEGGGVVQITLLAGPGGLVPFIYNSGAIHFFFTTAEWASFGYLTVLTMYVAGMPAWSYVATAGLRALVSRSRRIRARRWAEWNAYQDHLAAHSAS